MTVRRLSVYARCLEQLADEGAPTVSSLELAGRFGLNAAQVRKDLAWFGQFGVRGIGYEVAALRSELGRILGLDRRWRVALVGFGNLGSALCRYGGFARQGFEVAVVFEADPAKLGTTPEGVPILPVSRLVPEIRARGLEIAIIAVPADGAQAVADRLAEAGVRAVLNFAPAAIRPSGGLRVKHVDLAIELETLSFYLAGGKAREAAELTG